MNSKNQKKTASEIYREKLLINQKIDINDDSYLSLKGANEIVAIALKLIQLLNDPLVDRLKT
jgi:hypothetical protein